MLSPRHVKHVHDFTHRLARRWGVRIYRFANVGNHLHLLVRIPSRAGWQRFLREWTGGIAMMITGARKGSGLRRNKSGRGFWDRLAFTRIVRFGRDFTRTGNYLIKNLFESAGVPIRRLLAEGAQILTIGADGIRGAPS